VTYDTRGDIEEPAWQDRLEHLLSLTVPRPNGRGTDLS